MPKTVYSLCFMCSVRCPIMVEVENDQVVWHQGNPHVAGIEGALCAKGAAGLALLKDDQRLQHPMIRAGARGSNQWRTVSWDEALDYVADKLKDIIAANGPESVVWGERVQLSTHVHKAFMKALGSPNYFSHDALCKGSINTACRSLFGLTDAQMGMDFKNAKHVVLYGRNLFEALDLKSVRQMTEAIEAGAKLTYIDPRVSVTATKAHRYWMIRPGTDLAVNYAIIHTLLKEDLIDHAFVDRWVDGLSKLKRFVQPYSPEWAEKESGIPAAEIVKLAREVSEVKPAVIFNFGYRGAHHTNEIYFRRSIMIINSLLGSVEAKGGFFFKKGPGEVGRKPIRSLADQEFPKISKPRFDLVGTEAFPLPDPAHGVGQMLPKAILEEKPYPIKAMFSCRFEPLGSIPDTNQMIKALDKLDLIVTIDINHSDIAWYSDVVLPESVFFERTDCVQAANGLKPQLYLRRQAVSPRYDTKSGAIMVRELAKRMGVEKYFPYETMEDLVRWQLEPTGFSLEDFEAKGFVAYTDKQIFWDRKDGLKLKTPSGKIEFESSLLEMAGFESFPAYEPVPAPPEGSFRLIVGRHAAHTHVSTQNNPYLREIVSENEMWINTAAAAKLGVKDGAYVEVSSAQGSGRIKAKATDLIHPETVFMLHGFGHRNPQAARSLQKGVSDATLQENVSDRVGGSPALHHTFVQVRPVK